MTTPASLDGNPTLVRYYGVLSAGADAYLDGRDLLPLLAEEFVFDGPIAGRVTGAGRFAQGVRGFIENVRGIELRQVVNGDAGAAVLYDAELPGGVVRFCEFFVFEGDRIAELSIQYDAADYVAKGGR